MKNSWLVLPLPLLLTLACSSGSQTPNPEPVPIPAGEVHLVTNGGELDAARAALAASRSELPSLNDYGYWTSFVSWTGSGGETFIGVRDGVVARRSFEGVVVNDDLSEETESCLEETAGDIGTECQDMAASPRLIEELYDECRDVVLQQDPETNSIRVTFFETGVLSSCTYFPENCADDCSFGPSLSSYTSDW